MFDQVVDCERGDRVRAREVYLFFFSSILFSIYSLFLWYHSQWPLIIMLLAVSAILLTQSSVKGAVLEDAGKPNRRWVKLSPEGVDFIPSSMPAVCEWACLVGLFLSALSAICIGQYVDVPRRPYSDGLLIGAATVSFALVCLRGVPRSSP